MSKSTVESYFYCINRRKTLPDGSVIRFSDYPWQASKLRMDAVLMNMFLVSRIPSLTPPFLKQFEGPH